MNCRRIENLMPLFVEGDLDVEEMNAVSLHLNDCPNCSHLMSEYGDSQNWLRGFAPPEFDNSFFADLKQSVMQEIERKPARPTLIQQLTVRWNWKPTWAMAIIMVVLLGALAFYLYSGKTKIDSPNPSISRDRQDQMKEQEQNENQPQPKSVKNEKSNNFRPGKYQARHFQPMTAKHPDEQLPIAIQQKTEPLDSLAINIFGNTIDNNPLHIGEFENPKTHLETTRIEFQTGDPNIRIIWFAPKLNISQSSKTDTE